MLFDVSSVLQMIETQLEYKNVDMKSIPTRHLESRRPMQQRQLRCFLYKAKAEKGGRTDGAKEGRQGRPARLAWISGPCESEMEEEEGGGQKDDGRTEWDHCSLAVISGYTPTPLLIWLFDWQQCSL